MKRIKLSANLFLDEYIPRDLYEKYKGREHILIGLIDDRLIKSDQKLRDCFGKVLINNWWNGGDRNWSGLRTPDSSYYSITSQHSYGRGSDKIFINESTDNIQEYIRVNYKELGITAMELETSWVHTDVRNSNSFRLITFKP